MTTSGSRPANPSSSTRSWFSVWARSPEDRRHDPFELLVFDPV